MQTQNTRQQIKLIFSIIAETAWPVASVKRENRIHINSNWLMYLNPLQLSINSIYSNARYSIMFNSFKNWGILNVTLWNSLAFSLFLAYASCLLLTSSWSFTSSSRLYNLQRDHERNGCRWKNLLGTRVGYHVNVMCGWVLFQQNRKNLSPLCSLAHVSHILYPHLRSADPHLPNLLQLGFTHWGQREDSVQ